MSTNNRYVKPSHRILARFCNELWKYIKQGKPISEAIKGYSAYYDYNRVRVFPYERQLPWINHFACERLRELIKPGMNILEFGLGGSTLFFRNLGASVYSIEHDDEWFQTVKKELENDKMVSLHLYKPEIDQPEIEDKYRSVHGLFSEGMSWKAYAHAADNLPNEAFDLILIDGRARPECLRNSISKLKPGGMLVFDNSERESYQQAMDDLMGNWRCEKYQGVQICDPFFSETRIYFKPA
ncbi:class I SAM-dependent methyltransferase [Algoriphagus formosus]|uniref:Class I SAM-dependent methyltransferase n=1 Tax=Algoriphagus formosus TaxID=2007308 RepID=A0A4R5VFN4_9BACT|nr:class I SAM-dependent methyltransferase [Algoriphagus aquimaris]TDK51426.1 class I SAM-dependent methyltransferase [Algoriphagus aquimaris]